MDPFSLALGGLGIASNIFGQNQQNAFNQQMMNQSQNFNAAQADKQMAFQADMSSSAYQRASKDMIAAGLNPMMMFGSGSAASSPGGAMANTQPAQKTSAMSGVQSGIQTALNSAIAKQTNDKLVEEIANTKATLAKIKAETYTTRQAGDLHTNRSANVQADTDIKRKTIPIVINEALEAANETGFRSTAAGRLADQLGLAGRKGNQALSPINSTVSSASGAVRALTGLRSSAFEKRWPDRDVTATDEFGNVRTQQTRYKRGSKP